MPLEQKYLHSDISGAVIGAAYTLHADLGYGFVESVYKNGLAVLLREAGFTVVREVPFQIIYHGVNIGTYRADLVAHAEVIVEVKTARLPDPAHLPQLYNYLRASEKRVGLLINFGPRVAVRRAVWDKARGFTLSRARPH